MNVVIRMKHRYSLIIIIAIYCTPLVAQNGQIPQVRISDPKLNYQEPVSHGVQVNRVTGEPVASDDLERELINRIAHAYRLHLNSLEAQTDMNLVKAEKYITESLAALQGILDDYPDSQSNRRMMELYRTLMTEYQVFYGITEPLREVEGDIFAVQTEMFNAEDDFFEGDYFVLPKSLTIKKTDVPLILNRQVQNQIAYLSMRRPEIMERWMERSAYYFPMMKRIFDEEGVPEELIHLSMIESGLVPTARSHARAVGLWQFIQATGSSYGLEVNWWIDERRDPEKSTRAAARHLHDLHNQWKDWHLALANYNVSTRRMRSSIQAAGGVRDYWAIYPYLPRETRGYVPAFIAATMIATNPEEFGFEKKVYDVEPYAYDLVQIKGSVELALLAECAGISVQELRNMNPELLRWATPPGLSPYPLKLPPGTKQKFEEAYKDLPETARKQMIVHTVRRGESLGIIANRYGITVTDLFGANERLSSTIFPGQEIIIPVPEGSNVAILADNPSNARTASTATQTVRTAPTQAVAPPNSSRIVYTVKTGDTVGHIAEWFGVQAWQVRSWNNTSNNIRAGQRLTVFVPASRSSQYENINSMSFAQKQAMVRDRRAGRTPIEQPLANVPDTDISVTDYTVRRNDNLWDIARKYGMTVDELKRLNNLNSERIFVGQVLRVAATDKETR